MADLVSYFKRITDAANHAGQSNSADAYEGLEGALDEFNTALREYAQEKTREDILKIIKKLKGDAPLTSEEIKLIGLWIVGDAEYYMRMENNFEDWLAELKRITEAVAGQCEPEPGVGKAFCLRGVIADGKRVAADIINYLKQKERVAHFEKASKALDKQAREHLGRLLKEGLESREF